MSLTRGRRGLLLLALAACALPSALRAAADGEAVASPLRPARPNPYYNPYDAQLAALANQFSNASLAPPQQAVLLHQAERLRPYLDDRDALYRLLQQATSDSRLHRLVRDEANNLLAQSDVHAGRLDEAEQRYRQLGFIREWAVAGPASAETAAAATHLPAPASWRTGLRPGPHAWLDLADFFADAGAHSVAYAAARVESATAQQAAIRFASDTPVELWLNGVKLAAVVDAHAVAFDQQAVTAQLRAGRNELMLRLERQQAGAWRFGVRISAREGGGVPLPGTGEPPAMDFLPAAVSAVEPAHPPDLVEMATAAASMQDLDRSAAAARLSTLGALEQERNLTGAQEHLEAAARREPSAERWLRVAEQCGQACQFSALSAALRAAPNDVAVKNELAQYYFARGQLEKARDLLRDALRTSPDDFVARKRLADVYAAADLPSLAAREYQQLARDFPAPLWLATALSGRYESFGLIRQAGEMAQTALRQDFDNTELRLVLERVLERAGDAVALRRQYEQEAQLEPNYSAPLMRWARLESAAGNHAAAERLLRRALAIAPAGDALHRDLGEALALAGDKPGAGHEFQRSLELNPEQESLRARLQNVGGDAAASPEAHTDPEAQYLVKPAEIVAAVRRVAPAGDASAVALADVRVERLLPNGLAAVRTQQLFYIRTAAAAREFATRALQYAPGTHEFSLLHARIYKPDGRVLQGEDAGESTVADAAVAMYYDVRSRLLRFAQLEAGDVVELDYRLVPTARANPFGDYFGELLVFRGEQPQRLKRFVLIAPGNRPLNVSSQRLAPPAVSTLASGERAYVWEAHSLDALPAEPRAPGATELSPYVHVSTFASWDSLGRWYGQLIAPQFALDSTVREALARLLAGHRTEMEKIRAIHHFVLRNTHYVALEFGIFGYKPYPVSQVYARRFGDCKDKASLMVALLRAAGIPAELALVRTTRMGAVEPSLPSIAIFNHAVVYLPAQDMWLDGTAEYAGQHELPLDDQGAMALTVSADGRATLRTIPASGWLDNVTRRTVTARVDADGAIHFSGSTTTHGEDAPGLRRGYEVAERQMDFFRTRLAEVLPSVQVEGVDVDGATDLERDVTVKFRGTLDTFKGLGSVSLAASWMPRAYVQTLAPANDRTADLLLPAGWSSEEELHYELPAGARAASLPAAMQMETPFGSAALKLEQHGRTIAVKTSVQFSKLRITPQEYGAFRDFCAALDRAFHGEIKVALNAAPAGP